MPRAPTCQRPRPTRKRRTRPTATPARSSARILGVDLVAVMGLSASRVQTIITESGTAMARFPTSNQFGAWLGFAPRHAIAGGKVVRSRTQTTANRAGPALRPAAPAVARSDSAAGVYDRALRARQGPQPATVATAHKLARVIYHLRKDGAADEEESAEADEQKRQERERRHLTRRANKLGYPRTRVGDPSPESVP